MTGLRTWLTTPPPDPPTPVDRREVDIAGLRLPARASAAIVVVTMAMLVDLSRTLLGDDVTSLGRSPAGMRAIAIERVFVFGLVPLLVVLVGFRDRPSRYGLTLGDWRAGLLLVALGLAVMAPIVAWFTSLPDARAFYAQSAAPLPDLLLTNTLDLASSEFLFRGFLMFTLVRAIGPIGVLVAMMPFAFAHLGKPELEVLSTVIGGLAYGWLAWRTRSIVWGSIAHVAIVTVATMAAAGAIGVG
jgi:uncharacterized protein